MSDFVAIAEPGTSSVNVDEVVLLETEKDDENIWNKMPGVMINGTHYLLEGNPEAPLIVMIHGLGGDKEVWNPLVPELHRVGFRTLRYDLMGRGHSHPSNNGYDAEAHVGQLRALLDGLKLLPHQHLDGTSHAQNRYHIVGHSLGGAITTLYAAQYPAEIGSVVLLAPAGLMNGGLIRIGRCCCCLHGLIRLNFEANLDARFKNNFYFDEQHPLVVRLAVERSRIFRMNPHCRDAIFECIREFPLYGLHDTVSRLAASPHNISLLLVWGREDLIVPADNLDRWETLFTDGGAQRINLKSTESASSLPTLKWSSLVLSDTGHMFFHEQPEVNVKIADFFTATIRSKYI